MRIVFGYSRWQMLWKKAFFRYSIKVFLTLLCFVGGYFFIQLIMTPVFHHMMEDVYQRNANFLSQSETYTEKMVLTLAGLHAGLSVLQSSDFGVSFIIDANIQLGEVLEQLTSLIGHGRDFAMLNLAVLFILNIFLKVIHELSSILVMLGVTGVVIIVISELWVPLKSRWHHCITRCGETVFLICCLLVVIMPLAVNMAGYTSHAVTQVIKHNSYEAVQNTHQQVLDNTQDASMKDSASASLSKFKTVRNDGFLKENTMASALTRYIAAAVVEVVIVPGLFSLLLLWGLRSLVHRKAYS